MQIKICILLMCLIFGVLLANCFGEQARSNLLLQAVQDNDMAEVKELLADPGVLYHDLNPKCPGAICKPIFYAARNGSLEIVELLINAGADINSPSGKSGDTPLIIASYMHNYKLARLLIQKGADVNKANHFGANPFWGACFMGDYELVRLFIERAEINFPGRFPDLLNNNGGKKQLVEKITPLMVASKAGNMEIVNLLVSKGADIRLKDSLGRSALTYATKFKNYEIKNFLQNAINEKMAN